MKHEVPLKWVVLPVRRGVIPIKGAVSREANSGLYPGFSASGQDVWLTRQEAPYTGDGLVLSAVGARCGKVFKAAGRWGVVANTVPLLVAPEHDPSFLWYLVNQPNFWETGGAAQPYVRVDETLRRRMALPSLSEQRRITDFLDAELAALGQMGQLRGRQRALLSQRLISKLHVLYGGDGRSTVALKRRWRVIDCKHRTPQYILDGYPVVSPGDTTPGRLRLERCHRFIGESDHRDLADDLRRCRRGDIVYSRNASVGIASYVDTDEPFTMGQDVCRITSRSQSQLFLSNFLNYVAVPQLKAMQIGSTFSRVNIAMILELRVPDFSLAEQACVAEHADEAVAWHGRALAALETAAVLARERQQALITAAVTGQIDVRTARGVA